MFINHFLYLDLLDESDESESELLESDDDDDSERVQSAAIKPLDDDGTLTASDVSIGEGGFVSSEIIVGAVGVEMMAIVGSTVTAGTIGLAATGAIRIACFLACLGMTATGATKEHGLRQLVDDLPNCR